MSRAKQARIMKHFSVFSLITAALALLLPCLRSLYLIHVPDQSKVQRTQPDAENIPTMERVNYKLEGDFATEETATDKAGKIRINLIAQPFLVAALCIAVITLVVSENIGYLSPCFLLVHIGMVWADTATNVGVGSPLSGCIVASCIICLCVA